MCKRPLQDSGTSVKKRQRTSSRTVTDIGDLKFFFFTAASCGGLCRGCDLCHPEECAPEKANAIKKGGVLYKQVGKEFKRAFASLTCLFIRMRENFKYYTTPTAKHDHEGRLKVRITDDNGQTLTTQALKIASLAWGQVTQLAKLGTAGMPLRGFRDAFPVDHIDNNKNNNDVSNGMIMTKAEHNKKTKLSAEQRARGAMSVSAPCTMTVFVSKGNPLNDSEGNPVVINYEYRNEVKDDYSLTSNNIAHSIAQKDMPTRNSLVKIKYEGQDCLAQFSWYNLPDLEGEIWKPVTAADHKTLELPMSEQYEYYVSNMARFKNVTKSTQNERIRDFRGRSWPRIMIIGKNLYFYRVVALIFHRDQLNAKIAELKIAKQKNKFGNDYTFATLDVDHIDFDSTNHHANNLQFLTPEENKARSHNRPCRIWEIGKKDAQKEYPSVVAAANAIGCSDTTVHKIIKKNKHKKWRGEYIVE